MPEKTNLIDLSTGRLIQAPAPGNSKSSEVSGCTFDPTGRRVIRHQPSQLPQVLDQIEHALSESPDLNLYRYAGRLARVYQAQEEANIKRPAGAIMLHPVESAHLAELATKAANHEKWDARRSDFVPMDCPRRVADAFLARGHWPRLPDLRGFIETPTITADGRILDVPGYDADTGLFCAFQQIAGYQRPPEHPTQEQAELALLRLLELFKTFPFVHDTDRGAMLAGVLTAVQRRLLPSAPMLAITAPAPGTGKTLLCESLALIATGRRASVLSLGHDDSEAEKRLAGALLAGDAALLIDNVERPLGGDLLCQVLTQERLRLRPLGGSGMLDVPSNALMVATGNNLSIVGDLKRRVVLIRLDAQLERPEHRTFDRDHLATVMARRGEIIGDALTIIRAFISAGRPVVPGLHSFGGFEVWDAMVRRPLVWLGLPDPLASSEELRAADPAIETMRQLFSAWREEFSSRAVTAADVISASLAMGQSANDDLRDALQIVCAEKPNARRLGSWLRRHRDKILDGLQLKQSGMDGNKKVARWQVIDCGVCG